MIPLIFSQASTHTAATPLLSQANMATDGASTFGDIMSNSQLTGDDVTLVLAEGALAVPTDADPDLPVPAPEPPGLPALAEDAVREVEVPTTLPVIAESADADPVLRASKLDMPVTLAQNGGNPSAPLREGVLPQQQGPDKPVLCDGKTVGGSVAQSVLEGRLPLKGIAENAMLQTPAPKMAEPPKANALPPAASIAASAKPQTVIAGQVEDLRKSKIQVPDAQTRAPREDPVHRTVAPIAAATATAHVVAAQPPAVALAQAAAQPQREVIEKTLKLAEPDSILSAMPAERQISAPGGAVPIAAAAPETARQAAAQIAVAVTNSNGKTTEIALNPEELGRVKLSLSGGDSVIIVNVLAERPETQDLLRRHIDILAQEFRELGYTSISFSFGEQTGQARSEGAQDEIPIEAETVESISTAQSTPAPAVTGLDLRI